MKIRKILNELNHLETIKIYRGILLNDISELDLKNIGCHWTADKVFADQIKDNDPSLKARGDEQYTLISTVHMSIINEDATVESNIEYPNECEIVLHENSKLVIAIEDLNGEIIRKNVKANTGSRIDPWVKTANSYDDSEFIELIKNFKDWF